MDETINVTYNGFSKYVPEPGAGEPHFSQLDVETCVDSVIPIEEQKEYYKAAGMYLSGASFEDALDPDVDQDMVAAWKSAQRWFEEQPSTHTEFFVRVPHVVHATLDRMEQEAKLAGVLLSPQKLGEIGAALPGTDYPPQKMWPTPELDAIAAQRVASVSDYERAFELIAGLPLDHPMMQSLMQVKGLTAVVREEPPEAVFVVVEDPRSDGLLIESPAPGLRMGSARWQAE